MGTALELLFLLALGAIPGALLPQRKRSTPASVADITWPPPGSIGRWLDRLSQAFNVFCKLLAMPHDLHAAVSCRCWGCLTHADLIEHARSMRAMLAAGARSRNLTRAASKHAAATTRFAR